jgi:hypothetical protein
MFRTEGKNILLKTQQLRKKYRTLGKKWVEKRVRHDEATYLVKTA